MRTSADPRVLRRHLSPLLVAACTVAIMATAGPRTATLAVAAAAGLRVTRARYASRAAATILIGCALLSVSGLNARTVWAPGASNATTAPAAARPHS